MKLPRKAATAIIILIFVVVASCILWMIRPQYCLIVRHGTTNEVLGRYPISQDAQFGVGFIHSVNKSLFIDLYTVQDGDMSVEQTIYYAFGAGVETELDPSYTLDILPDGAMLLGNLSRPMDYGVTYIAGSYSDHTLIIGDLLSDYESAKPYIGQFTDELPLTTQGGVQLVSLSALAGRHTPVHIDCSYLFPWE